MSGWRIAVSSLAAAGGGPLLSRQFDAQRADLRRAHELGLVWCVNRTHWQLTAKGRALAEGRAMAVVDYGEGSGCRGTRVVATWLAALPPRNSIRLADGISWSGKPGP